MPTIALYNMDKEVIGNVVLDDNVFGVTVKEGLIHQALKVQLANRRAGTVQTKTRANVSGGGKKPFKQKGTGNARQGCSRAPQYPGGGTVFGPLPKKYNLGINKKARKAALRSLLSAQLNDEKITVLNQLDFLKISTKDFVTFMKRFDLDRTLIVTSEVTSNLYLSSRNIPYVKVVKADGVNVFDILKYQNLIITEEAVRLVEGVLQ